MRLALLVMAFTAAGCISPQFRRAGQGTDGRELPPGMSAQPATEMVQKIVSAKEEPNTLVASDRSSCRVSEQRFRETALGDKVFCSWSKT